MPHIILWTKQTSIHNPIFVFFSLPHRKTRFNHFKYMKTWGHTLLNTCNNLLRHSSVLTTQAPISPSEVHASCTSYQNALLLFSAAKWSHMVLRGLKYVSNTDCLYHHCLVILLIYNRFPDNILQLCAQVLVKLHRCPKKENQHERKNPTTNSSTVHTTLLEHWKTVRRCLAGYTLWYSNMSPTALRTSTMNNEGATSNTCHIVHN